jgi:hypothetical protein
MENINSFFINSSSNVDHEPLVTVILSLNTRLWISERDSLTHHEKDVTIGEVAVDKSLVYVCFYVYVCWP